MQMSKFVIASCRIYLAQLARPVVDEVTGAALTHEDGPVAVDPHPHKVGHRDDQL